MRCHMFVSLHSGVDASVFLALLTSSVRWELTVLGSQKHHSDLFNNYRPTWYAGYT